MPPFDGLQDFVKPDMPLAPLVWFRLGGHASFFAKPRTLDELLTVMKRAREASIALRILGGGSNVLVRDNGVDALVIHLESPFFSDVTIAENIVTAGTAVPLTALISQTARAGLAGRNPHRNTRNGRRRPARQRGQPAGGHRPVRQACHRSGCRRGDPGARPR